MGLYVKHDSNVNIWHGSLFTGLRKNSLPNMLFPAQFKTEFSYNLFSWKTSKERKFPLHNSVNIATKLENK
jgi:hypothetical protein